MAEVHPNALVEEGARLGAGVKVGPFCVVGAQVELGDGVELVSHVSVVGHTSIGEGSRVFPFASLGHQPQDLKFSGEESRLEIGRNCMIREHVTMNPGTKGGGMLTKVGDNCLFMVGVHIAHDCQVGNNVILANNAIIAGHVTIGDRSVIGGHSAVLQFVRIGKGAMIGGMSGVEQDVLPYSLVHGDRASMAGINIVGLKRASFPLEQIRQLRESVATLFDDRDAGTLAARAEALRAELPDNPMIDEMVGFILQQSRHGSCQPKS
ncbi:MAG: acyl-ACP--UDP-N-acetylglucosamine O-acyltransferase [Limibacillus sp.]